jgi:hypothetical protein
MSMIISEYLTLLIILLKSAWASSLFIYL